MCVGMSVCWYVSVSVSVGVLVCLCVDAGVFVCQCVGACPISGMLPAMFKILCTDRPSPLLGRVQWRRWMLRGGSASMGVEPHVRVSTPKRESVSLRRARMRARHHAGTKPIGCHQ
jgi:hypothetical protein